MTQTGVERMHLHSNDRIERVAAAEVASLLHDGYRRMFESNVYGRHHVKLRHNRNGRVLEIVWSEVSGKGCIWERGTLVKEL